MADHGNRERILHVTIKDCEVQTFRAGGKGGQNQNKRDTGVRIIHPPSGARGESRDARTQPENKKRAWRRMAESKKFQAWVRVEHAKRLGALAEIEEWVDEQMAPVNLEILVGEEAVQAGSEGSASSKSRPASPPSRR